MDRGVQKVRESIHDVTPDKHHSFAICDSRVSPKIKLLAMSVFYNNLEVCMRSGNSGRMEHLKALEFECIFVSVDRQSMEWVIYSICFLPMFVPVAPREFEKPNVVILLADDVSSTFRTYGERR